MSDFCARPFKTSRTTVTTTGNDSKAEYTSKLPTSSLTASTLLLGEGNRYCMRGRDFELIQGSTRSPSMDFVIELHEGNVVPTWYKSNLLEAWIPGKDKWRDKQEIVTSIPEIFTKHGGCQVTCGCPPRAPRQGHLFRTAFPYSWKWQEVTSNASYMQTDSRNRQWQGHGQHNRKQKNSFQSNDTFVCVCVTKIVLSSISLQHNGLRQRCTFSKAAKNSWRHNMDQGNGTRKKNSVQDPGGKKYIPVTAHKFLQEDSTLTKKSRSCNATNNYLQVKKLSLI